MQNNNLKPEVPAPKPEAAKPERGIRDEKFDEQNEGFLIGAAKKAAEAAGIPPEQWEKWAAKAHPRISPRALDNFLGDPGARLLPSRLPGARDVPIGPQHDLIPGRHGGTINDDRMLGRQAVQNIAPPDVKPGFDPRIVELDKMDERMANEAMRKGRDAVGMPVPKLAPQDAAMNKGRDAIKAAQQGPNAAQFNDDMIRAVEIWANGIYRGGNRDPRQQKVARELHGVYRSLKMYQQQANDAKLPQQQREAAKAEADKLRGVANAYLRYVTNTFIVQPGHLQLNQEGRLVQPNPAGGLEYLPEGDKAIEQQQREALQMPAGKPAAPAPEKAAGGLAPPAPKPAGVLPRIDPGEPAAVLTDPAQGLDNFNRLEAAGVVKVERDEAGVPVVSLKMPGGQFMQIPLNELIQKNPNLAGIDKRIGAAPAPAPAPVPMDGAAPPPKPIMGRGLRNRLKLNRVKYQAPGGFEVKPAGKDDPGQVERDAWQQREPTEAEKAYREWAKADRARQQARPNPLGFPEIDKATGQDRRLMPAIRGQQPAGNPRQNMPSSNAQRAFDAAQGRFKELKGDTTPSRPTPLLPGDPRTERLGPGYREAYDQSKHMGSIEQGAARDRAREILAQPPIDPKDPNPDKMSDREWGAANNARTLPGQQPYTQDERAAALKKLERIRARQRAEQQLRGQPKGAPGAAPKPAAAKPNLFPAQPQPPEPDNVEDKEFFSDLEKSLRAGRHIITYDSDGNAWIVNPNDRTGEAMVPVKELGGWTPPADLMPKRPAPIKKSRAGKPVRYSQEGIQAIARQNAGGNVSAGSMAVMQRFLQNLQEHDPEGLQKIVASNKLPERSEHYKWLDSLGEPTVQYIKHLAGVRTMNGGDANPKSGKLSALAKKILIDPAGYRSNLRELHHALLEANQYGPGSRPVWPDRERMLEVAGKLKASGRTGELDQYLQSVSKGIPLVDIDESPVPQQKKDDKPCCDGCGDGSGCSSDQPAKFARNIWMQRSDIPDPNNPSSEVLPCPKCDIPLHGGVPDVSKMEEDYKSKIGSGQRFCRKCGVHWRIETKVFDNNKDKLHLHFVHHKNPWSPTHYFRTMPMPDLDGDRGEGSTPDQHASGVPVSAGFKEQVARLAKGMTGGVAPVNPAKVEDKRPNPANQPKPFDPPWGAHFTPGWEGREALDQLNQVGRAHKAKPGDPGMEHATAHDEVFNQLDDEDFERAVKDYRAKYGDGVGGLKKNRPAFVKPEPQITHMGEDEYKRRMDDVLVKRHPIYRFFNDESVDPETGRNVTNSGILPSSGDSQAYEATRERPGQRTIPRGPGRAVFNPKKDLRQQIIDDLNAGL